MPIYKGSTEISKVYKGSVALDNVQAGTVELWTNAVAPTVSTSAASSVGTTSMRANGNVTSDGGASITSRGFYFGTSSNYASNTKYTVSGTTGAFNRTFSSLSSNTTYYFTAFAVNSAGESVGSTVSQATNFNYTFKSGTVLGVGGTDAGLYYQLVNGSWQYRSNLDADAWGCESYCTNRTNRYYASDGNSRTFWTMKGTNNQTQAGCPGNSMSFGSFNTVVGADFSNGSSYWQIRGTSSGLDIRFTAS